jgi:hypothetical protein
LPLLRNHRERKEAYVKSLETEVVQLRANEARILNETKGLYAEITVLKRLLVENGIQVPTSIPGQLSSGATSSAGEGSEQTFDLYIPSAKQTNRKERIYSQRSGSDVQNFTSLSLSDFTPSTASPRQLAEMDHTAVGIDFVLA